MYTEQTIIRWSITGRVLVTEKQKNTFKKCINTLAALKFHRALFWTLCETAFIMFSFERDPMILMETVFGTI